MIAAFVVFAIVVALIGAALVFEWAEKRARDGRLEAWLDGFDSARRLDRQVDRRWSRGLETRERRPLGVGPGEVDVLTDS